MPPRATACRYCGESDGLLAEGAHPACKISHWREKYRERDGRLVYTNCKDCRAGGELNRVGRCGLCQHTFKIAQKREALNRWKKANHAKKAAEIVATRVCKCGCGRHVKSARSFYASMQCASRIYNAKARTPKPKVQRPLKMLAEPQCVMKKTAQSGPITDALDPLGHLAQVVRIPAASGSSRWDDWAADRELYDPAKARVVDAWLGRACQR